MKFTFTTNSKFDENLEDLRKRGKHQSLAEVIKEALIRYDWILTETEQGREIVSIQQSPQPPKNKWNQNIRLVHSREE